MHTLEAPWLLGFRRLLCLCRISRSAVDSPQFACVVGDFCWLSASVVSQVLEAIATFPNICRQLHLPAQSGSTTVLVSE